MFFFLISKRLWLEALNSLELNSTSACLSPPHQAEQPPLQQTRQQCPAPGEKTMESPQPSHPASPASAISNTRRVKSLLRRQPLGADSISWHSSHQGDKQSVGRGWGKIGTIFPLSFQPWVWLWSAILEGCAQHFWVSLCSGESSKFSTF